MNGTDLLLILVGVGIVAACMRQMHCNHRRDELERRHLENRRNWRVVERCEQYSMRHTVDSFIDECLEEAA